MPWSPARTFVPLIPARTSTAPHGKSTIVPGRSRAQTSPHTRLYNGLVRSLQATHRSVRAPIEMVGWSLTTQDSPRVQTSQHFLPQSTLLLFSAIIGPFGEAPVPINASCGVLFRPASIIRSIVVSIDRTQPRLGPSTPAPIIAQQRFRRLIDSVVNV